MVSNQELLRFHDLHVVVTTHPDEDINKHISRTFLGTPGKMRYRQKDANERMKSIKKIWFLSLRKKNRLLGTAGLAFRQVKHFGTSLNAYYVRYTSIFAPLRSTRSPKREMIEDKSLAGKQNFLKDKLLAYFDKMDTLNADPSVKNQDTISYAFIEKDNARSMNFSNLMGYRTVREFKTVYFSRFYPKLSAEVRPLKSSEIPLMSDRLSEMYAGYTLFFKDHLFRHNHYFVLLEGNEIIAGVQAEPVHWEIIEMPGISGSIFMKWVPHLPLLSRLFTPENFNFAAFEGLWYKKGSEKKISILFESVCALFGFNIGLTWVDTDSSVSNTLKSMGKLGFLSNIKGSVPAAVRIKFFNQSVGDQSEFIEKPAYISAYDLT